SPTHCRCDRHGSTGGRQPAWRSVTQAPSLCAMNKLVLGVVPLLASCASLSSPEYDVVLRGGTIYDGSGGEPYVGDVALAGDRIAALGHVDGHGRRELDVRGRAVAPGFVNMLSWATDTLLVDGRALSDVAQGITLEVM